MGSQEFTLVERKPIKEVLPKEIRRKDGKLIVNFQARFPDGTAFRRMKEFDDGAVRSATTFLERAKAEFARGNGVGSTAEGPLTIEKWSAYCLDVVMPAQKNNNGPKYSDETLAGFREVARLGILPRLGSILVDKLDKQTVTECINSQFTSEASAKTLYVLTRIMEVAEAKGKRRKGTNPCNGVSVQQS